MTGGMIIAPGGRAPSRAPDQDIETLQLQLDRWARASRAQHKWAETARVCQDFFEGNQWSPEEEAILKASGRPALKINRIAALVRMIKGYFRQNRYDVRYLPASDGVAGEQGAEALNATFKQIAEVNQSKWNHAEVFADGIVTGRGFLDYRLDQTRNVFGEIKETVLDPFSTYPDPEAETYDSDGWQFVQISRWLSWYEIANTFGQKVAGLVDSRGGSRAMAFGGVLGAGVDDYEIAPDRFFGLYSYLGDNADRYVYAGGAVAGHPMEHVDRLRKLIRVLECQHRVLTPVRQFVDLQTGMTKVIPDDWNDGKVRSVIAFLASRNMPVDVRDAMAHRIRHTITAADVVLYDDWSPYETMTVVPYFAYFRRGKTMGMVEDLIDPQREVNKRRSVFLHIVMTAANSGWIVERGALADDEREMLENEGARPGIVITHEKGFAPPKRIEPAVTPVALSQAEEKAQRDLEDVSGINRSAQGNVDRVQSGRAVLARQKQAIIGAEQYFDNFARTRELVGRKVLEMVQRFYTEQRMIRVRGEDGKDQETIINQRLGTGAVLNDVTSGSYLVAVDEAPMADTFQDQQFQDIVTMVKDLGIPVPPEIIVEASSIPRKREIIKALQGAAGAKPPPKVTQNINFKDLPPTGKAQMAAEVGIKLDPAELTAHEAAQAAPEGASPANPAQPMPGPAPGGPGL